MIYEFVAMKYKIYKLLHWCFAVLNLKIKYAIKGYLHFQNHVNFIVLHVGIFFLSCKRISIKNNLRGDLVNFSSLPDASATSLLTRLARADLPVAVAEALRVARFIVRVAFARLTVSRRVLAFAARAHAQARAIVTLVLDDVTAISNPPHCVTESRVVRTQRGGLSSVSLYRRDTEHNIETETWE